MWQKQRWSQQLNMAYLGLWVEKFWVIT
jgi:hypothetical protein